MDTSNNIISRMGNWHTTAVNNQKTADIAAKKAEVGAKAAADKALYQTTLDKFTTNFEEISKLDQSPLDRNNAAGNVETRNGTQSLKRTADGFVMTVVVQSAPLFGLNFGAGAMGAAGFGSLGTSNRAVQTTETYTVDEKSNTISLQKTESTSNQWKSAIGGRFATFEAGKPILMEDLTLDLNSGTVTKAPADR